MPVPFEKNLEYLSDLTPDEVFTIWRNHEEHLPHWQQYWREKGFSSWEEWRRPYRTAWNIDGRIWKMYGIKDPLNTVPQFRGGPYKSWAEKYYGDKTLPRFADIADNLDLVALHEREGRLTNFPRKTTLTGLATEENIYIIEGMHRAASLAILRTRNQNPESVVFIALAETTEYEMPINVGGNTKLP
jgi:hypothetical protein